MYIILAFLFKLHSSFVSFDNITYIWYNGRTSRADDIIGIKVATLIVVNRTSYQTRLSVNISNSVVKSTSYLKV